MYHTEGFVNKYTMNTKKHIIMLTLEQDNRPWYLWCVVKEYIAKMEVLKQLLSFWLQQTLLTKGCNVPTSAQRELNRLGGYLQNMDKGEVVADDIELFMYYKGQLYQWDSEMWCLDKSAKTTVTTSKSYREISTGIYGYVSEEALWSQYLCDNDKTARMEPEALANAWELSLLESCGIGEIEHGFFLIWEDKGVF